MNEEALVQDQYNVQEPQPEEPAQQQVKQEYRKRTEHAILQRTC